MFGGETQIFRAVLGQDARGLGWTIARIPFDPAAVWPNRVRLRVRGEVNGFPFRSSLFAEPDGAGSRSFCLLVNRAMQAGGVIERGTEAEFRLEPDLEPRPAELPEELDALLDEAEGLRAWYGMLSESVRREIGKWVLGVKGEHARLRRAQAMAERMVSTMEAEVELPPLLAWAFAARPRARAGWEHMTAAQRRGELFAVFYYQTPEARAKRLSKLLEAAEDRCEAPARK